MEGGFEPTRLRDEVFSSFSEIFNDMDKMINYFIGVKRSTARWSGALAGAFVMLFGVLGVLVVDLLAGMSATEYFIEHPGSNLVYFGLLAAISFLIGMMTYSIREPSLIKDYILWKSSLGELKKAVTETERDRTNIIERTLKLIHQAAVWLPNLVRYKSEEAFIYGVSALLLSAFLLSPLAKPITLNLGGVILVTYTTAPIPIIVGLIVWLYFRNRKRKEAEQQIRRLEGWRQKLEEGEEDFLRSI